MRIPDGINLLVHQPEGPGRPLLLIEDNPMDVDLTLQALSDHNVANPVIVCQDGEEAMAYLQGARNYKVEDLPLLILLDLRLPRRSGLEVLEHAKKDLVWKAIPITVLTTSRHSNDIRAAYGFGVNSYVVKPVQSGAFYEVIDRLKAYWLATNQALPES